MLSVGECDNCFLFFFRKRVDGCLEGCVELTGEESEFEVLQEVRFLLRYAEVVIVRSGIKRSAAFGFELFSSCWKNRALKNMETGHLVLKIIDEEHE